MASKNQSSRFRHVLAIVIAAGAIIAYFVAVNTYLSGRPTLEDNFNGPAYALKHGGTSPNGLWHAVSDGGGSLGVEPDPDFPRSNNSLNNHVFYEYAKTPSSSRDTASVLALSNAQFHNFQMSLDARTDKQLRESSPHPWEVAWVIWRWVDNTHFYYFVQKTNGIEVGKYDGGANPASQIIIQSQTSHPVTIGKWTHWEIFVLDSKILISINGDRVFSIEDSSSFDAGKIGLYSEDSKVSFGRVAIQGL